MFSRRTKFLSLFMPVFCLGISASDRAGAGPDNGTMYHREADGPRARSGDLPLSIPSNVQLVNDSIRDRYLQRADLSGWLIWGVVSEMLNVLRGLENNEFGEYAVEGAVGGKVDYEHIGPLEQSRLLSQFTGEQVRGRIEDNEKNLGAENLYYLDVNAGLWRPLDYHTLRVGRMNLIIGRLSTTMADPGRRVYDNRYFAATRIKGHTKHPEGYKALLEKLTRLLAEADPLIDDSRNSQFSKLVFTAISLFDLILRGSPSEKTQAQSVLANDLAIALAAQLDFDRGLDFRKPDDLTKALTALGNSLLLYDMKSDAENFVSRSGMACRRLLSRF